MCTSLSSLTEVQSGKVSELNVAGTVLVTAALGDEVLDVLLADGKLEEVGEHLFEVCSSDVVLVSFVEELETFACLLLLSSFVPLGLDDRSHKIKLDGCSLLEVHICPLKIAVNLLFAASWLVVPEIVQDITEMSNRNVTVVILVVVLECILQVG